MSLRSVLTWPDERLKCVCTPVGVVTPKIKDLACDMLETMYAAPGRGLAAPQVGELKRLFVMDATWKSGDRTPMVFVDPSILWVSEARASHTEGCLSIPGVLVDVERPEQIRLKWKDLNGVEQEKLFEGFEAVCVQHELDHLDGKFTFDRVDTQTRTRLLKEYKEATA